MSRGYSMGAAALKQLDRLEEATRLLEEAVRIDPTDFITSREYARLASETGDWAEALRRWTLVKDQFETPQAWVEIATCLRELGRMDEAVETLNRAYWRYQNDSRAPAELAWIAHRSGDWPEAIRQWEHLREIFPRVPAGYIAGAQALRAVGRVEEAEAVLLVGADRLDNVGAEPLVEYARFAHGRGDWPEAVRRWEAVRARLPDRPGGYIAGAEALEEMGRHQEAAELRAAGAALRR
jgi:tetratricopeptide (TPR) repeat protein